jgi:cholesterol transport system auxiliary component
MKHAAAVLAGLALLTGCVSVPDVPPREYYVLEDLGQPGAAQPGAATSARVLLVQPAAASPFYDTQHLAFSRAPGQRAYYQFAAWTERPARRLGELLTRRLEARGSFRAVAATTAGVRGDVVLNLRLEELYHDAGAPPGSARVELSAELIDATGRVIVARRRFAQSAPSAGDNARAAVAAFNQATTALLEELAAWVESAALRPATR